MRLSETSEGTWGNVDYFEGGTIDEDGEFVADDPNSDEGWEVRINELSVILNEAQDYVCKHLYDIDFAFFESEIHLPLSLIHI